MRYALTLSLAIVAALVSVRAHAAEQVRTVGSFSTVANSGPVSVRIEVGKPQSVTVSGPDDEVRELRTEVVGNELRIDMRHDTVTIGGHHEDLRVTITVPQLSAYSMAGAGETILSHISGDSLEVHFGGAGSLKADGSVHNLKLHIGGVGAIDTRDLHADNVEVNVGGVGSVKVWAGTRLDANVGGVGSLTYYGNPKTANTHGGGLGSISRGD